MTFRTDQYQLLDFGDGRKLERFGTLVLDRPSPAAQGIAKSRPDRWPEADARFEKGEADQGTWRPAEAVADPWLIEHGTSHFHLKASPFGHVGVFPEQAANWDWIARQVAAAGRPLKVLNLFAYTGGSTLAAAHAGAEVVHVDAARNMIARAQENAAASGLADAPIRWIVEDALRFATREAKRGNRYDAVILDPPSYGHGPKGQVWRLTRDLIPLLEVCWQLTASRLAFVLLTCHSPGYGPSELRELLAPFLRTESPATIRSGPLTLIDEGSRRLNCGVFARWSATS